MSEPLVSVIVPCHNAAAWLEATIASVRAQTWRRLEIILVDDGSTDGSGALADRLAGPDLRVVHQNNAGQCAALNHGLRLAQGDFYEYLDADDLLAPEKIEVQIRRLQNLDPGWMASGAWARFADDPARADFEPEAVWNDLAPVDWLVTSWRGGGMMHGAAWLIPRTLIEAAGPWNEELNLINDLDYFPRVILQSRGVAFCPAARSYYRSGHAGNLSGANSRRAWVSAFKATALAREAVLARENSPRTRAACADNLQRLILSAYPFVPDLATDAETEVARLGGSQLKPGGGRPFQVLCHLFGWKVARRAQALGRKIVHGKPS
jgi:glycosyltransferase involved in cell wall biosynthesis